MNDPLLWLIIIAALSAVTLFFSINSTSLRVLNRIRLQEACKNIRREELATEIVENAQELATVCSFYRLAVNFAMLLTLVAWLASQDHVFVVRVKDFVWAFFIAMAILSVFSLAIPHAIAKYVGERILVHTYGVLKFFAILAYPVLLIIKLYDALVRRLAGVSDSNDEDAREELEEEFLNVVEQGKMEGIVDQEQQEMIEGVLDLSDRTAEQIMTPRTDLVSISNASSLQQVLDAIATGHSRIPVYESTIDNIIGFIYAKDMLNEIGRDESQFDIKQRMRPAYFVPETKPLRVLLHEFQNQKLHIAVVLDEYGGTAGLVTIEDILEELVGEITDEYEESVEQSSIKRIDEATAEVDARMPIGELNAEMEIELPDEEDYDTVGGFVFSYLGYIPKNGESFEWQNLKFTILQAETRRINLIRIHKLSEVR